MNLVMFDVDGTLTATTAVDHLCYVQAVTEALGIRNFDTNWTQYRNVTDQGCLEEIILTHARRQVKSQEISDPIDL